MKFIEVIIHNGEPPVDITEAIKEAWEKVNNDPEAIGIKIPAGEFTVSKITL